MMKKILFLLLITIQVLVLTACSSNKNPEWMKDAVIYEVNVRQYTEEGTFNAFSEHLPRLKKLGINVLWFMPIHPISQIKRIGSLGSYYSVQDYQAVNPEFGTIEDFKNLVNKAHDMGFKVILDWVANHTGWDNKWIIDHPEWYLKNSSGQIVHPPETNWEDVAQLDYENKEMQKAMIETMEYWVKEVDVDGFRCDYAGGVPVEFWEKASKKINKIKNSYMLAEDNAHYDFLDKAFNSNYGWDLLHIMNDISRDKSNAYSIQSYYEKIEKMYPDNTYPIHFTTNHDENSWSGNAIKRLGASYKAMSLLTFTFPGVPLIYSGQEAGLNKELEFFEKDEIDWSDLSYQEYFKELIDLKKDNKALYNGKYGGELKFFSTISKVIAFERTQGNNKVIVVINLSPKDVKTTINFNDNSGLYNSYFDNETVQLQRSHSFELNPWQYKVFISNE